MNGNKKGMSSFHPRKLLLPWCLSWALGALMAFCAAIFPVCATADQRFQKDSWSNTAEDLLFNGMTQRLQIKIENSLDIPLGKNVVLKMVKVEHGTFQMGPEGYYRHEVTITNDYWIGCYPITQLQYKTVTEAFTGQGSKYLDTNNEDLPQVKVSWETAFDFCTKLNYYCSGKLPKGYYFNLPTEAQWEYAATGGKHSKHYRFSGGDNPDNVAWHQETSSNKPHPVGRLPANELGIHDMSGNVWEWCFDRFADYEAKPATDPQGPIIKSIFFKGKERVNRGGCYSSLAEDCSVTHRHHDDPSSEYANVGFRVVLIFDPKSLEREESAKKMAERLDKSSKWVEEKVKEKVQDVKDYINNQ